MEQPVVYPKLNFNAIKDGLEDHPDKVYVRRILDYVSSGVPIGYTGPRQYREHKNWPSSYQYSKAVTESIIKDVKKGRKAGPFYSPPFEHFVGSPMGAFPKKRSVGKYRIIHDLSWPPGHSINDYISSEEYGLHYISVDDIAALIVQKGPNVMLSKLDLEDAFKHVPVRPEDWELLGSTWFTVNIDGNLIKQYFVDTVLPFGLRSAPKLFDDFASALQHIMCKRGVTYVNHYLDDFITMDSSYDTCRNNLKVMLETCEDVGFGVNYKKVEDPTTELEFLGIVLDTKRMEMRISVDRLKEIMSELQSWRHKTWCTKRQLLSIIGKLTFVSKVVKSGRTFVRRMIELSKHVKHLHHRIRLNTEFRKDVEWWIHYLPRWNGVGMMVAQQWLSSVDLCLFTDASNIAIGAYFQGEWFIERFEGENSYVATMSINWRELYALVKAAATWASKLANKNVLFYCDNISVVYILQSGTSKVPAKMDLVRSLFFVCANNNIVCSATYINTLENSIADALSRENMEAFWKVAPNARQVMTQPTSINY